MLAAAQFTVTAQVNASGNQDAVTACKDVPASVSNTGTTIAKVPKMTFDAPWTLTENTLPLPIDLKSFEINVIGNKVKLVWATSSETNNYGFNVERSTDKVKWTKVGFVAGNMNSNILRNYTFENLISFSTDDDDIVVYYRLKQITDGGGFCVSDALSVTVNN